MKNFPLFIIFITDFLKKQDTRIIHTFTKGNVKNTTILNLPRTQ